MIYMLVMLYNQESIPVPVPVPYLRVAQHWHFSVGGWRRVRRWYRRIYISPNICNQEIRKNPKIYIEIMGNDFFTFKSHFSQDLAKLDPQAKIKRSSIAVRIQYTSFIIGKVPLPSRGGKNYRENCLTMFIGSFFFFLLKIVK